MQFITEGQQRCYEEVAPLMTMLYGESAFGEEDVPVFRLTRGSLQLTVAIAPWGDEGAVVEVGSWVVLKAEPSVELYGFLLERSFEQRFGAFTVDNVGDIQFVYRLAGHTIDKLALKGAVEGVLWTAGRFDGEIIGRFGGIRPSDAAAAADFERALDEAGLRPPEDSQAA